MKARLFVAGALVAAVALPASAQDATYPQCSTENVTKYLVDACATANDLFRYMTPQLGTALAGGNATLGTGSTLGGIGHFSIGLRANVLAGRVPDVEAQFAEAGDVPLDTTGTAVQRSYAVNSQIIGAPTVDAAIGVFGGLPLAVTKVGGVDLLLSASYLPEYNGDNLTLKTPDGSLKIGYGARVGLIQESLITPGVSFTWLKRDLPTVDLFARVNDPAGGSTPDTVAARGLTVKTTAWRLVASKRLLMWGLAAGVGQDKYSSAGNLAATVVRNGNTYGGTNQTLMSLDTDITRTNVFLDASMNLPFFKLVGEVGHVSGGDVPTYSTFEKKASDGLLYGSFGFRFQL